VGQLVDMFTPNVSGIEAGYYEFFTNETFVLTATVDEL